jgi:hypothetical protein
MDMASAGNLLTCGATAQEGGFTMNELVIVADLGNLKGIGSSKTR